MLNNEELFSFPTDLEGGIELVLYNHFYTTVFTLSALSSDYVKDDFLH